MIPKSDLMTAPRYLLVAEAELVTNIYVYRPLTRNLTHFGKKGAVLSLDGLLALMRLAPSQVLMLKSDLPEARKRREALDLGA